MPVSISKYVCHVSGKYTVVRITVYSACTIKSITVSLSTTSQVPLSVTCVWVMQQYPARTATAPSVSHVPT